MSDSTTTRQDPPQGSDKARRTAVARSIIPRVVPAVIAIALVVLGGVFLHDSAFDLSGTQAFNEWHVGMLGTMATVAYRVLEPGGAITLTVITACLLGLFRNGLRDFFTFGATVAVAWLPVIAFKPTVDRPRPNPSLMPFPFSPVQMDGSYISGHTAFVTAFMLALVVALRGTPAGPWVRRLCWLPVVGIACAVLIDGVHFPTDVAAAIVWSLGVTPLVSWAVRAVIARITRKPQPADHDGAPAVG